MGTSFTCTMQSFQAKNQDFTSGIAAMGFGLI